MFRAIPLQFSMAIFVILEWVYVVTPELITVHDMLRLLSYDGTTNSEMNTGGEPSL